MCIVFGSGFPRLVHRFLAAAFHGFPRLVHRFWQQLSTAFHDLCIVFGSSFPRLVHRFWQRLSTACVSFLAAAFHGFPRLVHRFWQRFSTAFHDLCIVFGSGFPRLSTTCAPFFCVFRGQYGSIAGCGPCGRPPLQFPDFVNASPIFNQPYSFLTKTNKTLAVTQGLRPLFLLRLRFAPKQASASRSRRRNSLRSSGLHHSKKNLENKPERS